MIPKTPFSVTQYRFKPVWSATHGTIFDPLNHNISDGPFEDFPGAYVIYPDGTADTNAGKVDLSDTLADEDDLTLLIDLVNDYSDDFVEDLDESVEIDSDEEMPQTVTFWDHNYGEICATRCFNPDYNTDKSYWECADEDGTGLGKI